MNNVSTARQSRFAGFAFSVLFLSLNSLFFLPMAVQGESRAESRAMQSKVLGKRVRYSVLLPASYDQQKTRRYPILYYLHGLGDNEQTLLNWGGWTLVSDLQEKGELVEFLIVTPEGGRSFYVNSHDGRERYEDFFIQEFIPAIEKRYRTLGTRAGRGISGVSMGGYGALRFAFKYPKLFAAVSVNMPALAEDLPEGLRSSFGLSAFGRPFDAQYWKRLSPFSEAREANRASLPKIYFDCGRQDDFGFDVGAQEFHSLLTKLGVRHEYHLYPGNHSAEYVMAHLEQSLRFQSQSFGAAK